MKTAMQKLITNLETMGITFPQGIEQTFLSIEKEQIIQAYINGYGVSFIDGDNRNFSRPQEYYNQTYNQNKS
jgi:hypothetical protein